MDIRWLTASDADVGAAVAALKRDSRPAWVPNKRQVLVHVNNCLLLWYLCIVFMTFSIRVDDFQGGQVTGTDVLDIVGSMVVFAAWLAGTVWLTRWAARPPTPQAQLRQWRQDLTALANGFEPRPRSIAQFSSFLGADGRPMEQFPRFEAPGIEFGNLTPYGPRAGEWRYLRVALPAPLPHLVLDATVNDGLTSDLPEGIERQQRLSVGGEFDNWFRVYSPTEYGTEALYVLTPDVMADLIDHAWGFNVEIRDTSIIFFTRPGADFADPASWQSFGAILTTVVPRITAKAARYLDERVPGQDTSRLVTRIRAELDAPDVRYVAQEPRIGHDGRRLALREWANNARWGLRAAGWLALLTFLYVVPGLFAFAGFMSIVDGR